MKPESSSDSSMHQPPLHRPGTSETMDPASIARIRQMTYGEKIQEVVRLYNEEIARSMARLQTQHLDWSKERLRREAGCLPSCGVSVAEFNRRNAASRSAGLWVAQ